MQSEMIVKVPPYCSQEFDYILKVLLQKFLGIDFQVRKSKEELFELVLERDSKSLSIATDFFRLTDRFWLNKKSFPKLPLTIWDLNGSDLDPLLTDARIPVLFGEGGYCKDNAGNGRLKLDVFGSAFFMLTCYSEAVTDVRDKYDRFPGGESIAYQEGFLHRPIVNEYLEILWSCMKSLWPDLERKKREFRKMISCDVDRPYHCGIKSPVRQLKHIAGDLFRRKNVKQAFKSVVNYCAVKVDSYQYDSYYSRFDWLMGVNERAGNRVAFYFLAGESDPSKDGCYSLDEPAIRRLIVRMHTRGHEVGLHPSFDTYKDQGQLGRESDNLRRVLKEEGIKQEVIGSRQHYLRWDALITAKNWEAEQLSYDSTLGYADHTGFRCGVCYEFPLYDLAERRELEVVERPLIVMEGTLLDPVYNAISQKDVMFEEVQSLVDKIKIFHGDFTLLWHNSYFEKSWYANCYEEIVNL